MSEHVWILENIETYHAGGVDPDERERFEQHTAACAACAQAFQEARGVDNALDTLFAEVRPEAALEDRMIQFLRNKPGRNGYSLTWLAAAAAAVLMFGVVGAGASYLVSSDGLPFPGLMKERAQLAVAQPSGHYMQSPPQSFAESEGANDTYHDSYQSFPRKGASFQQTKEDTVPKEQLDALGYNPAARALGDGHSSNAQPTDSTASAKNQPTDSPVNGTSTWSVPQSGAVSQGMGAMGPGLGGRAGGGLGTIGGGGMGFGGGSGGLSAGTTAFGSARPQMGAGGSPVPSAGAVYFDDAGKVANKDSARFYSYRNDFAPPPTVLAISPDGKQVAARTATDGENKGKGDKSPEVHFRPGDDAERYSFGLAAQKEEKPRDAKSESSPQGQGRSEGKGESRKKLEGGIDPTDPDNRAASSTTPAQAGPRRMLIRSGDIEFEIESFDAAVATVTKLVSQIKGGFVGTVNSDRLANGKVRGSLVVRVPPEALDSLVLDLRKELGRGGELKSLKIGSQDITKQYTDMESRLRAARAMEERLLKIIKDGKGEIKDLLNAEKELGIWRTKIEELEGEIRYFGNLVALSTLNISLYEKEIRAPYAIVETERVQMGIEVEDVDKAQQQVIAAVADVKGRITKSELKQHGTGQLNALIHFEVAPEAAGPLRDRLRQLGNVARLDIDRVQQTEGGTGSPQAAKSKRNDTQFQVSIYNVATVAPRETVQINLACVDTEAVYRAIVTRVNRISGRVVTSNLNRQKDEQSTATINCEVKTAEADALLDELKKAGDVMRLQLTENPDVQNVTRSRRGFNIQLFALGQVQPRETQEIQVAARDVPSGYRALLDAVTKAKGRVVNARLNEQDKRNINGEVDVDIRRADEAALQEVLAKIGDIFSRNATRAQENENVLDTKLKLKITLRNVTSIPPRQTVTMGIEVADVEQSVASLSGWVNEVQGRTLDSNIAHERDGRVKARVVYDVPLASADSLISKFKGSGRLRVLNASRNETVPDSALATARLDVTLANSDLIIPSDEGLWTRVRTGLSNSLLAIFWSLSWVIFGVLVLLPWALVLYAVYRVIRRFRGPAETTTPAA